ncbi:MAG: TIGR02452 family protein [Lachnospiraceae bacterium]|nr:TIGR02452 family protein [Lachnospiraceae bacterium]
MNENIEIFHATQEKIEGDERLYRLTKQAMRKTRLYEEGFHSSLSPVYRDSKIVFEETLTLIPAAVCVEEGLKTAVLNFANPVEPGGGVLRGANAQEEYLCRASNLYPCLTSPAAKPYYDSHKTLLERNASESGIFLSTDQILYSPGVTVIREDAAYIPGVSGTSGQIYTDNWKQLDVITCAAPFFSDSKYRLPSGDLWHLYTRRIKNILETAIENGVEALILGAFGCGAFHNPPRVVAGAFQDVFMQERYRYAFKEVIFAVKRTGSFCENIEAFELSFSRFPSAGDYIFSPERNKRRFFS